MNGHRRGSSGACHRGGRAFDSLLRTIEQVWGLGYLGYAGDSTNVKSMTPLLMH